MMTVPHAHCQLINMDHIRVDGIGRPILEGAQICVPNCPAAHSYLKQFSNAAHKVPPCFPLIQKPANSPQCGYRRDSYLRNDSCFHVQSRSASGCEKTLSRLPFAPIRGRKSNLSQSQLEIMNIPRSQNTETAMSEMVRAGQIKSPLQGSGFNPHPYDDAASRNIYLNTHSSFLQRPPCWNSSTSPMLEIAKKPSQQRAKKKRRRKRRNRKEPSEQLQDNGKMNGMKNQLMNILTALSLSQVPHPPPAPRQMRSKQRAADARALVALKNEPPVKLSSLCGWIGQPKNEISHRQLDWTRGPSPPKEPKRRRRKSRRARKLQVRGQGISPAPEILS